MRCDTCIHWYNESNKDLTIPPIGVKKCNKPIHLYYATTFERKGDELVRVIDPKFANQRFFTQDASDYAAEVYTRGNFFCADWCKLNDSTS